MGEEAMVWRRMKLSVNDMVLIAVAVLCGFMLSRLFPPKQQKNYSKEYHALQDSVRVQVGRDRDYWRGKYDSVIAVATKKDTMLIREYRTNTIKYEKIPNTVNSFSDDELRRAVTEF